jgi:hypothetical protein
MHNFASNKLTRTYAKREFVVNFFFADAIKIFILLYLLISMKFCYHVSSNQFEMCNNIINFNFIIINAHWKLRQLFEFRKQK